MVGELGAKRRMTYIVRSAALRSHCAPEDGVKSADCVQTGNIESGASESMMHPKDLESFACLFATAPVSGETETAKI